MTADIEIGEADASSLQALLALYQTLHPEENALDLLDAESILAAIAACEGSAIFIARAGDQIVSSVTLMVIPNLTRNGRPYALIENVVTDFRFRRMGLAGRLLKHAVAAAWGEGCYKVMLLTGSKDPGVLSLYGSAGFEQNKTGFQIRKVPPRED